MANSRSYSSTAQATTLTGSITSGSATMDVAATTGFPPSPSTSPYILSIDYGAAAEELVLVTAAAGLTLTITRGYDGTSAQSHSTGAVVKHVASAIDYTDSRTHEAATSNVHGLTGGAVVVGTTQAQTLSSKTISGGTFSGTIAGSPTFSGTPSFGNAGLTGTLTASGSATLSGTFAGSPTFSGAVSLTGAVSHTGASSTMNELVVTNDDIATLPLKVNAISGTTAKLVDLQVNGASKFTVDATGLCRPTDLKIGTSGVHSVLTGESGQKLVSFTNQASFTVAVTFATAFAVAPVVLTNIASGAGAAAHWDSRPINITTTGFDMFVFANDPGGTQTWSSIPVNWNALGA